MKRSENKITGIGFKYQVYYQFHFKSRRIHLQLADIRSCEDVNSLKKDQLSKFDKTS